MIELERTFLAKQLPSDLNDHPSKEMVDVYIPAASHHPVIRLRRNGGQYELTKKEPIDGDRSRQTEQTITLTKEEFDAFSSVPGKRVAKRRYRYPYRGVELEVDVFETPLDGLVIVDAEFANEEEKAAFTMPEFCLVDVTHEEFIAGGMLCGKAYADIAENLEQLGYVPIRASS